MWFWKRKEIWAGVSMQNFNRVREILAANGTDYDFRMNNQSRLSFDRGAEMGRYLRDPRFDTIYYVYVAKNDEETARRLLSGKNP